jgi:NTP pyrophosphatase (non-canonical NTP hydrolase)
MNLKKLQTEIHQNSADHGFWSGEVTSSYYTKALLMMTEISEFVEELRNNTPICEVKFVEGKPVGPPIELADLFIRLLDLCGRSDIDLEKAVKIKMSYNKTRPYMHGNKQI